MWIFLSSLTLITLVAHKYIMPRNKRGYWKLHGMPEMDASCVASEWDILLGKKDVTERDDYVYEQMGSEKFTGVLENPTPIILIKDLGLIKQILVKDFDHFVDRRQFFGGARNDSVLRKMLGNLKGSEWKGVRSSVSPTFTSGQIRRMMGTINSVAYNWTQAMRTEATLLPSNGYLTIDVFTRVNMYTIDVIAGAIFGLNAKTVGNPNSKFSIMANRMTTMSAWQIIKFTLSLQYPRLFQFFGMEFLDVEALAYFEKILKQNLKMRVVGAGEETRQTDFLQMLIEARNGETAEETEQSALEKEALLEETSESSTKDKSKYLSDDTVKAQSLTFFFAGVRTTSSFITFALYALAIHPDVQDRLRREVDTIIKDDNSFDYDDLSNLIYMDMILCEILRKFPSTLRLERTCIADYNDAETGLFIPKGTIVGIPLKSIHHDKKFYENPETFDPEHFRPDAKAERNPYAFMPFGIGPRNCIGMRIALMESKAAIAHMVHTFIIEPTENTPIPLTGTRVNFQIAPPPGLELKLIPRMNGWNYFEE